MAALLASLVYVWDRETDRVLLVLRDAREHDVHFGKANGLGGKLERDESILDCACRELREEAGITPARLQLRGTVSWPGFGRDGEDWFGFVFLATGWSGSPPARNEEGRLLWASRAELLAAASHDELVRRTASFSVWAGDRFFLPLVFDTDPRTFHAVLPYESGKPLSFQVQRL